jgi:transcriptional regulator GlxA family with amidase domain
MSDLVKRMSTNKTYLSEVIAGSEYRSFYQLINTLRVAHACRLLEQDPTLKMEQVALASGFSSGSAFSQVFKRIKGISPSEYLH